METIEVRRAGSSGFQTIDQIRQANRANGHHWFSPDTMRFFDSRVSSKLYGGRFFVTSEVPPSGVREYSVRMARDTGEIETVRFFTKRGEEITSAWSSESAHALAQGLAATDTVRIVPDSDPGCALSNVMVGDAIVYRAFLPKPLKDVARSILAANGGGTLEIHSREVEHRRSVA